VTYSGPEAIRRFRAPLHQNAVQALKIATVPCGERLVDARHR